MRIIPREGIHEQRGNMTNRVHYRVILQTIFFINMFFFISPLNAIIDLDDMAQDFVLEMKRIEIPGYPGAFNPSIIRWQENLLLSFRYIPNPKSQYFSEIGLVWLDENFWPIGIPHILDTKTNNSTISARSEDARLITVDNRLYMVYSDNKDLKISKAGYRVYIAELSLVNGDFVANNVECILQFEGESQQKREKNWTPFDYNGNLLLAYSLDPHRILRPLLGTGSCESFSLSERSIKWAWGELRGGTQGLKDGDSYLSFFHSSIDMATVQSNNKVIAHYFMGAYVYNLEPPFEITHFSSLPIIAKGMYDGELYKPYWKPIMCVFPCGHICDDQYVWVTYGRQDREVWITKLDKKGLLESLIPIGQVLPIEKKISGVRAVF